MSRLSSIYDDANSNNVIDANEDVYVSYKYLGRGTIVEEDYVESQTKLTYLDVSGNVTGLDRFGRVVDQVWKDYDSTPDTIDEYTYTYDRAGNRLTKTNVKNNALNETYTYDGLDRLSSWYLGGTLQKTWNNDGQGNNLAAGTYNAANEETPTQGSSAYDAAGNMITLQSGNSAIYDAWNRQTKVKSGTTTIQQNEYDGTNRRIQIFSSFSGSTATVQDDYYGGQHVIESDVTNGYNMTTGGGTRNGGYQMVWSPRYVDSLILRDTLNTAGTAIVPTQRVFYLSDANYNVTGLVKYDSGTSSWTVAERYTYTPYGVVTYRNTDWSTASSSANNNTTLYTGRTLDLLTGLDYYRARFYDAVLERFVSRDPIGYKDSDNLHEYVHNSPLVNVDPTGLWGHGNYGNTGGPSKGRGHSDMPGQKKNRWDPQECGFDYTVEDRRYTPFDPAHSWRHFRTLEESESDLKRAVGSCDKVDFETYAHQMQDWFSHRGQGYENWDWGAAGIGGLLGLPGLIIGGWGHARGNVGSWLGGAKPDDADAYDDAYRAAVERTQEWLGHWNECCSCKTKDGNAIWTPKQCPSGNCDSPPQHKRGYGDQAPPPV
jgi:RHS repeat-associated protein